MLESLFLRVLGNHLRKRRKWISRFMAEQQNLNSKQTSIRGPCIKKEPNENEKLDKGHDSLVSHRAVSSNPLTSQKRIRHQTNNGVGRRGSLGLESKGAASHTEKLINTRSKTKDE